LTVDRDGRTITVSDNGIGMDKEDLENNLGVIASSGSFKFKQELGDDAKDTDVIGQFGVGFYSAFMVADHITVVTKKYGSDTAYMWQSAGADGYTITECEKDAVGTDIIMHVKPDTDDEKYSEFLESWRLQELVRKYSDYIRFPIRMEVSKTRKKEGCPDDKPEYETYTEVETLNSMVPIWQRRKSSVKPEEYNKFYRDKFHDYTDPQRVIAVSAEGAVTYKALLFIPGATPYDYYTKEYEKGLQLYSNGVLIMDKCADLLPEHFRFVRGVVDSPDLSLNISRELLQHDRQLKVIATNLEKKIKNELLKMMKDDREGYEKFWKNFGRQLKFGVVSEYGAHKDLLGDLLMFYSSTEKKPVTLSEYVSRMKEDQKYIYYASGETLDKVDKLPQTEMLKDKGIEILYFTEDIDEFCAQTIRSQDDKELRSILDQEIEEGAEKKAEEAADSHKATFDFVKEALGEKVKEVKASARLKSHPVCLTAGEGLSFEMEKYFLSVQPDSTIKADRILELNVEHPAFAALETAVTADPEKAKKYAELLYDQALLIAGLPLEDPSGYTDLVCELMK
ncbi:molecular chaperone HtpG, partial [Oscillibacter sp.]|uniref:molecular chaperone HtpG n=1 Tax=Oscillibacter sp. TaxID=1945593 RepID=UPI001B5A4AA5